MMEVASMDRDLLCEIDLTNVWAGLYGPANSSR